MKCPYRKRTITFNNTVVEQYLNCHEYRCPLYFEGKCARAEMEKQIFNKDYNLEDFTYERESDA